jgi:hypothetical protein
MINNTLGQTAFLRSLVPGEPSVWYCKDSNVDPEMRKMTAILCKNKPEFSFKIKQKKALLVLPDEVPQSIIIIERV